MSRIFVLPGKMGDKALYSLGIMHQTLTFEAWKALLRFECIALGKLDAFNGVGEVVLRILYENGVDPTVEAIVRDGLPGKRL